MTTFITRSPLQALGMNRTQAHGSKRRSTRHLFDDDEEGPPTKKAKGEQAAKNASSSTTITKQVNGKASGAIRMKAKKAYEEVVDNGFAFTRSKSNKAKQQPESAQAPLQPEIAPAPTDEVVAQPPRKKSRKTLPVTPEKEAPAQSQPRRSQRISGGSEAEAKSATPQQAREGSPAVPSQNLQVDKKRRVTKIDLLFAETPVIRRNKEMRKTSSEQHRRSSSGIRGKRASSLIDAGTSNAVPHTEVATMDFYKHISQDLTEPKRMRQLLVWCGDRARAQLKKPGGDLAPSESQAIHAARVIQDELLNEFGNRGDLSNWFDRPDTAPAVLVRKPNPRNEQNAAKLQELEAELARLQAEKRSWDELSSETAQTQLSAQTSAQMDLDPSALDPTDLDPSQASILHSLLLRPQLAATSEDQSQAQSSDIVSSTQSRIDKASSTLEFKLDFLADSLHRLEQYRQSAERVADRILASGAEKLDEAEQERKERNGGPVDSFDVLKALSRAAK